VIAWRVSGLLLLVASVASALLLPADGKLATGKAS
jgi:hypothetical protein